MVESVDTRDLKSLGLWLCGFKSRPGYQENKLRIIKAICSNVVTAERRFFCVLNLRSDYFRKTLSKQ
jgi:hypothetical protein